MADGDLTLREVTISDRSRPPNTPQYTMPEAILSQQLRTMYLQERANSSGRWKLGVAGRCAVFPELVDSMACRGHVVEETKFESREKMLTRLLRMEQRTSMCNSVEHIQFRLSSWYRYHGLIAVCCHHRDEFVP